MTSVLLKTYYAQQKGIDPRDIYMVAVMPCVAKKYQARRPEHYLAPGVPYTDAVLTTRELIWMIKSNGIDSWTLPQIELENLPFEVGDANSSQRHGYWRANNCPQ